MHGALGPNVPREGSLFRGRGGDASWLRLPGAGWDEAYLTLSSQPDESPAEVFQRFYRCLEAHPDLRIVRQDVFGVVADDLRGAGAIYRLNGSEWPWTWVEGGNGKGCPLAGIQAHAVGGLRVEPIRMDGRTIGSVYEDEWARWCVLGGLRPSEGRESRFAQAQETFRLIDRALAEAGLTFRDVYRTWFYLDDILDWYGEFNEARNQFFREQGVFEGLVPASTGVGGRNAGRTAVVADLLALRPKRAEVRLAAVPSPRQGPALEYGSAFSRAVEVNRPGQRRLYISGTASIAPDGRTAHAGDVRAQVALTMEVVEAILESRGLGWSDAVRAIAYFKDVGNAPVFAEWCRAHGLAGWPVMVTQNDICREDLLFEVELDAVAGG